MLLFISWLSEIVRLVSAFMAGLNRTAKLKFTHPGLATTATRDPADRLVIQNDIGTTDAHVIVIHVQDLTVSVTYTDVHAERLAFFQDMLKPRGVAWEKDSSTAVLAAGAPFLSGDRAGSRRRMPTTAAPTSNFLARAWSS